MKASTSSSSERRTKASSGGKRAGGASVEATRAPIVPDESVVNAASQQIFLNTATARAYPHVEGWLRHQAQDYTAQACDAVQAAETGEAATLPVSHTAVLSSRSALAAARSVASARAAQHKDVRQFERLVEHNWLAGFRALAQSYLDALSAMEAALLDRRAKARQWCEQGEKASVLASMAHFESRRAALATRSQREQSQIAHARRREQQRLKLALESCLVEIHDVVAWHAQQPHAGAGVAAGAPPSAGDDDVARRGRQLLAVLGGAPAVRAYLGRKNLPRPVKGLGPGATLALPTDAGQSALAQSATAAPAAGLTGILCHRPSASGTGGGGEGIGTSRRDAALRADTRVVLPLTPAQAAARWLWGLIEVEEAREAAGGPVPASDARKGGGGGRGGTHAAAAAAAVPLSRDAEAVALEAHAHALHSALGAHLAYQREQQQLQKQKQKQKRRGLVSRAPVPPRAPADTRRVPASDPTPSSPTTPTHVVDETETSVRGHVESAAMNVEGHMDSVRPDSRASSSNTSGARMTRPNTSIGALPASRQGDSTTAALLRALDQIDNDTQRAGAGAAWPVAITTTTTTTTAENSIADATGVGTRAHHHHKPPHSAPRQPHKKVTDSLREAPHARAARPVAPFLPPLVGTTPVAVRASTRVSPPRVIVSTCPPLTTSGLASAASAAPWSSPSSSSSAAVTGASVEALAELVQALHREREAAREAVEVNAESSLAWLQRLESVKARAAAVLLANVSLEQQRKALLGRAPRSPSPPPPRIGAGAGSVCTVAVNTGPRAARRELEEALHARQSQLSRLEAATEALTLRVQHRENVLAAAGRYWHHNAVWLRQSGAPASVVAGVPTLGLRSAQEVADFIATVF